MHKGLTVASVYYGILEIVLYAAVLVEQGFGYAVALADFVGFLGFTLRFLLRFLGFTLCLFSFTLCLTLPAFGFAFGFTLAPTLVGTLAYSLCRVQKAIAVFWLIAPRLIHKRLQWRCR